MFTIWLWLALLSSFVLYENIGVSGDVCLMAWESGTYSEVFGVKDLLVSS